MQNNYFKIIFIILTTLVFINVVNAETNSYDATISGIDSPSIYDLDIKWDNMTFSYIEQEKYIYDSTNSTYKRTTQKYWSSSSNNINIKNKSLREVNVSLKYKSLNNNVTGTFSKDNFNIKSSEEQNIKLNLSGSIDSSYHEYKTVGEISIIVS